MSGKKLLTMSHVIFSVVGIAIYLTSFAMLFKYGMNLIALLSIALNIVALVCGLFYLKNNYRKESAQYYKTYMWILAVSELFETATRLYSMPNGKMIDILSCIIPFALFLLLASAKDYGKKLSFIISIALIVSIICQIIPIVNTLALIKVNSVFVILDFIGQFTIAVVTAIMVCGKYIDKESRGAK